MDVGEFNGRRLFTGLTLDYRLLHPHRALSLSFLFLLRNIICCEVAGVRNSNCSVCHLYEMMPINVH